MHITLVLGTSREGRNSERVFSYLSDAIAATDATLTTVDVRDHVRTPATVPAWEESAQYQSWRTIVQETDAFVFILPEYNHGYPGEWKLLIDTAYQEYAGKVGYLVGVSGGSFGGARVVDHARPILVQLGLNVQRNSLYIGDVEATFTESGVCNDPATTKRAEKFVQTVLDT